MSRTSSQLGLPGACRVSGPSASWRFSLTASSPDPMEDRALSSPARFLLPCWSVSHLSRRAPSPAPRPTLHPRHLGSPVTGRPQPQSAPCWVCGPLPARCGRHSCHPQSSRAVFTEILQNSPFLCFNRDGFVPHPPIKLNLAGPPLEQSWKRNPVHVKSCLLFLALDIHSRVPGAKLWVLLGQRRCL